MLKASCRAREDATLAEEEAALLRDVGAYCQNHHDHLVRENGGERVQADEGGRSAARWRARTYAALGPGPAIDPDSKLIISFGAGVMVGAG